MSKESETYRFAVGSPDGPRSSTWRIWVEKDSSIYIGPRDTGGQFKVSLHPRGYWRVEGHRIDPPGPRLFDTFTPAEVQPGLRRGVTIVIPWLAVHQPKHGRIEPGMVHWLPMLADGHVSVVDLAVADPAAGEFAAGPEILAVNPLANGSTVWLLHSTRTALPHEIAEWTGSQRQFAELGVVKAKRDASSDVLSILVGNTPDGARFFVDLIVPDQ